MYLGVVEQNILWGNTQMLILILGLLKLLNVRGICWQCPGVMVMSGVLLVMSWSLLVMFIIKQVCLVMKREFSAM